MCRRTSWPVPAVRKARVLVVDFTLVGQRFMPLNGRMRFGYNLAVSFAIECEDQAAIDRLWEKLGEAGKYEQCGRLRDCYGVPWQITPRVLLKMLADPDPAKAARVMGAVLEMVKLDIAALEKAYRGA
jgi:predicted 3-demethylubiquinone-9 3-methyltransferase (glyoxalase superfamily)